MRTKATNANLSFAHDSRGLTMARIKSKASCNLFFPLHRRSRGLRFCQWRRVEPRERRWDLMEQWDFLTERSSLNQNRMSGFCASIHIFAGKGAERPFSQVLEAVRATIVSNGRTVPADDSAEPDRTVFVSGAAGTPWISVYDSTLDPDEAAVDWLASRLSAELETFVVGLLVHDSDLVLVRLHEHGQLVDAFSNRPEYFGEVGPEARKGAAGQPKRWKALLAQGTEVFRLGSLFEGAAEFTFAEDFVEALATMLGLDPASALQSFDDLTEAEEEPAPLASMTRLAFRLVPGGQRAGSA
jgi:hypothetical protein